MTSALSQLLRSLTRSREGVLPSLQAFPPLDVEEIAARLNLDSRAREQGMLNQPDSASPVEDSVELDIRAEIERHARKAEEEYRSNLDLYEGRIRRSAISADQRAAIEAAGETALTDFRVRAREDLDHLRNAREEVKGREREFETFRAANRLNRPPIVVSARDRAIAWLVLAILLVLESILNGVFFAEGSEMGLVGGVAQAVAFSVLNIGTAVLYARFALPLFWHVHVLARPFWIAVSLGYVAWVLTLNLFIGHFRDLFVRHGGQVAGADLLMQLSTAPLSLADGQSLLLVGLGVAMNIVAVVDAARMDDPYPRYGAIGRRRAEAVAAYAEEKTRCFADLKDRRDVAIEEMSQIIEEIRANEYELRIAIEGRMRLHENYCSFIRHLEEGYNQLLRRYYEKNMAVRTTPAPARFQVRRPRPDWLAEPRALEPLKGLEEDARALSIERMTHFIQMINREFEEAVAQYQTVDALVAQGEGRHEET